MYRSIRSTSDRSVRGSTSEPLSDVRGSESGENQRLETIAVEVAPRIREFVESDCASGRPILGGSHGHILAVPSDNSVDRGTDRCRRFQCNCALTGWFAAQLITL